MRTPTLFVALLFAALLSAGVTGSSTPAAAAAPLDTTAQLDTLRACAVDGSGTLYRVGVPGAPSGCKKSTHKPVQWDASGISGTFRVELATIQQAGQSPFAMVECPGGARALAGGYTVEGIDLTGPFPDLRVLVSAPGNTGTFWILRIANAGNQNVPVTLYALCART